MDGGSSLRTFNGFELEPAQTFTGCFQERIGNHAFHR